MSEAINAQPAVQNSPRTRICPECGASFVPKSYQQTFCTTLHKTAFQNRAAVDGRAIIALAKAWRLSRNQPKGSPNRDLGQEAFSELCATLDNMLERDRSEDRTPAMTFDYVRALRADGRDWRDRASTSTWGRPRERKATEPRRDPIQEALEAIAKGHNDPRALAEAALAAK